MILSAKFSLTKTHLATAVRLANRKLGYEIAR